MPVQRRYYWLRLYSTLQNQFSRINGSAAENPLSNASNTCRTATMELELTLMTLGHSMMPGDTAANEERQNPGANYNTTAARRRRSSSRRDRRSVVVKHYTPVHTAEQHCRQRGLIYAGERKPRRPRLSPVSARRHRRHRSTPCRRLNDVTSKN